MASSKVEIANIALVGLRAAVINSFSDGTTEANAVDVIWDTVRQSELAKHPYNFAMKRASLNRLTTAPSFGYAYQYQLPVDCLRVWRVEGNFDYRIEGNKILTDEESAKIVYVYDNDDITTWSSLFSDLVAARLRVELAYTLAADETLLKLSKELYDRKAMQVKFVDSSQDYTDEVSQQNPTLIGVRY